MDNHRAALWCWFQHIDRHQKYDYIHIDAHYDDLSGAVKDFSECQIHLSDITLDHYLKLTSSAGKQSLIRWDNYHPIFFECYAQNINRAFFCTQKLGKHASENKVENWEYHQLNQKLDEFSFDPKKLILNFDLDFLFTVGHDKKLLFEDEWINTLSQKMKFFIKQGSIVTIALSPECSGGWDRALATFKKYFSFIDLDS
ncbi:MAG: hypothetical protein Fur0010_10350 [Bdellovibrio sp.]